MFHVVLVAVARVVRMTVLVTVPVTLLLLLLLLVGVTVAVLTTREDLISDSKIKSNEEIKK